MLELRLRLALEFGDDALRQHFAELDTPLIEGIDVPDGALRKYAVLVESDEFAQDFRRQPLGKNGVRWAIAFEHAMRHQPVRRAFGLDLLGRLAERERFGLREYVGNEDVMMPAKRIERPVEGDEVARDQPCALMDQLVERVLAIGSRARPSRWDRFGK